MGEGGQDLDNREEEDLQREGAWGRAESGGRRREAGGCGGVRGGVGGGV